MVSNGIGFKVKFALRQYLVANVGEGHSVPMCLKENVRIGQERTSKSCEDEDPVVGTGWMRVGWAFEK